MLWKLNSVTTLITCVCITHKAFSADIAPYSGVSVKNGEAIKKNNYGMNAITRFSNLTVTDFVGSTVLLVCPHKVGDGESTVEWYKEDEVIYYGYNEYLSKIELKNVTEADSGTYKCKICTVYDCSLAYFQLKVISERERKEDIFNGNQDFKKIVQYSNESVTTFEGRNVHLTCLTSLGYNDSTFEWFRNNKGILQPYGNSKHQQTILLKAVTLEDSGIYACKTCTFYYCSMLYFQFTVRSVSAINEDKYKGNHYGLNAITRFSNLTVTHLVGSTVRLICPHELNGESIVEWFEKDEGQMRSYGYNEDLSYVELEDLTKADSGTYTCKACNVYECSLGYLLLKVISESEKKEDASNDNKDFKEVFLFSNETVTTFEGRNEHLTCLNPVQFREPTFEWFKEDEGQLQPYGNSKDLETITLKDVTTVDSGIYACKTCIFRECCMIYFQFTVRKRPSSEESHSETTTEGLHSGTTITAKDKQSNKVSFHTVLKFLIASLFLFWGIYIVFNRITGFCKKKKRERSRRRLAREISRAAKLPRCTKKIVVERQTCTTDEQTPSSRANETDILMMPSVRIVNLLLSKHNGQTPKYELPVDPAWEIPRESLVMGRVLGEGAFGKVVQAEARRTFQQRKKTTVAVKMLKDNHAENDLVQFVKEMEVMKMIGKHCNIVNLLGCCTQEGPLLVVIEFAPHGNVRDFLRKHRSCLRIRKDCNCLTERDLVTFAYQVAKGMDYLSSRKYIHGDLAARNVLVSDDYVLKISDFGFARKLQQKDYYRRKINGLLPIKWMAPESLFDNIYTTQSDVWSYGILLWEFVTLGGSPYPSVANLGQLYKMLKGGYRMEKPEYCTLEMYSMMTECWKYEPNERPSFGKLVEVTNDILASTTTVEYLELSQSELGLSAEEADVSGPTPISSEEQEGRGDVCL